MEKIYGKFFKEQFDEAGNLKSVSPLYLGKVGMGAKQAGQRVIGRPQTSHFTLDILKPFFIVLYII